MTPAPLLQNTTFGPDEIVVFVAAFEGALRQMDLVDRADPATEMVARKTIELARHRESVMLFGCGSVMSGPPPDAELILGRGRVGILT